MQQVVRCLLCMEGKVEQSRCASSGDVYAFTLGKGRVCEKYVWLLAGLEPSTSRAAVRWLTTGPRGF